ncbi:MAG TPA: hypothetical protein VD859_13325, partial [Nocardioides sp.]|nr:hypothetical protein [Nocardioides sp.]
MTLIQRRRQLPTAQVAALAVALAAVAACAPADDEPESSGQTASEEECAVEDLLLHQEGVLTVATDKPAYEPWFVDTNPT